MNFSTNLAVNRLFVFGLLMVSLFSLTACGSTDDSADEGLNIDGEAILEENRNEEGESEEGDDLAQVERPSANDLDELVVLSEEELALEAELLAADEPVFEEEEEVIYVTENLEDGEIVLAEENNVLDSELTAAAYMVFDLDSYNRAIAQGQTVLLNFHSDSSDESKDSEPALIAALNASSANIVGYKVSYDYAVAYVEQYEIDAPSSYVLLMNGNESGVRILGPGAFNQSDFANFLSF
jgi:hypothetical protein